MNSECRRIYHRMQLYVLAEKHPHWHTASYATYLDKSERWVRKWLHRFETHEDSTLGMFLSESRAPKTQHRQTAPEVKKLIGDLREELSETYHRTAGAKLIRHELLQRDDLKDQGFFVPRSLSTINAILKELGYIQPRKTRYREPVQLPEPNEEWEMDFGEIRLNEETKLEFFIVVDRGTSRVIYLEGSIGYHAETALEAVARLLVVQGLPQRLRFDRDPRFVGSWTGDSYPSALVRFLRVVGVEPVVCPPRRPDLKPFVERCIRTLKEEWLDRYPTDNFADAMEVLPEFIYYHNAERVHFGRACNGQIPNDAFPALPTLPNLPETVAPNSWLEADDRRLFRRRITSNGSIQIDKHRYYIDRKLAKTEVLIYLDAPRQQFLVTQEGQVIHSLDIKGLHPETLSFQDYLYLIKQEARSIEMHRFMTWYQVGEIA